MLSAIFLLVGIQGTSLIRFSSGSNTFELERRKRNVERAVAEAAKDDPDKAEGIIRGAEIALPALGSFSQSEWLLYEARVTAVLNRLGYNAFQLGGVGDRGIDIEVFRPSRPEQPVYVEVKYRSSGRLDTSTAHGLIARSAILQAPYLIVTNAELTTASATYAAESGQEFPVRLVRWRDELDNRALQEALEELFGPA